MIPYISNNKTIPISELRKRFGDIEARLPYVDYFVLTKNGEPFATLSAFPNIKKSILRDVSGSLKNTELDNDKIWRETRKKKSRKTKIKL